MRSIEHSASPLVAADRADALPVRQWEAQSDCVGCEEKIAEFKARKKPKVAPAKKKKPAAAKKPAKKKKSPAAAAPKAAAPKAAAPAKKPAAVSAGEAAAFVVAFKITGSITEWDDNTFTECATSCPSLAAPSTCV